MRQSSVAVSLVLLLTMASSASAQVVTSPGVLTTGVGGSTQNDPLAVNTWLRREVRSGSSIGIDATYPRNGTGSIFMSGTNSSSKGDLEYYFDPTSLPLLSSFQSAAYDYYRDAVSTVSSSLVPAFRLIITDPTVAGSFGYLIFEPIYDTPGYVAPTNAWQAVDLSSAGFWLRQYGTSCFYGSGGGVNTVSEWAAGATASCEGGSTSTAFTSNVRVLGVNVGFGSGWSGSFQGAVDNIEFSFENGPSGRFNFETTGGTETVPEPATMTLLATGLAGLAAAKRRKRALR